jgi:hypothetical protein
MLSARDVEEALRDRILRGIAAVGPHRSSCISACRR